MKEHNSNGQQSIYMPAIMKIVAKRDEAPGVKTLRLEFQNPADLDYFRNTYRTGMFGLYGIYGEGESTFCVASPETRKDYIECTFRQSGRVTSALASAEIGDLITYRGPYGNRFPIEEFYGKNLLFIAGGIALPPTRSVIWSCLDQRDKFGKITIVYGARTVADLVYKRSLMSGRTAMMLNWFSPLIQEESHRTGSIESALYPLCSNRQPPLRKTVLQYFVARRL